MVLRQLHLLPPALVHDHRHPAGGKDQGGAGKGGLSKPGIAWGEEVGGSRGESCGSNSSASQSLAREPKGCKETPKFWGFVCLFLVVCIYVCVCMLTCMYMCVPNEARSRCQIPWMWNYRPLPCVGAGSPTPVLWENSKRP